MADMGIMHFKILFEIRVLHDYFLTQTNGNSFFDLNKSEKTDSLNTQSKNQQNLSLFTFNPNSETKDFLNGNRLIFKPTALGFLVGIQVKDEFILGETLYKPIIELDTTKSLKFNITTNLNNLISISNLRLKYPIPTKYYFTNSNKSNFQDITVPPSKALPLSNQAIDSDPNMNYEMGALVNFGGTLKQAIVSTTGIDSADWIDVIDRRFVSISDKTLLPHNFRFSFIEHGSVTQAKFELEDGTSVIKTISKNSSIPFDYLDLKFEKINDDDSSSTTIPPGDYILKATINGGNKLKYPVHLDSNLYSRYEFGAVEIFLSQGSNEYDVLNDDGYIITKLDNASNKIEHPIFELRLSNRKTYWRFNKEIDFSTDEKTATNQHLLSVDAKTLVSKKPKGLSQALIPFINGSSTLLPQPKNNNIKVEGNKIFSEIYINKSNRLIKN